MIYINLGFIGIDLGMLLLVVCFLAFLVDVIIVILGEYIEKWEFFSEVSLSIGTIAIILSFLYFSYSVLTADYSFNYVYSFVNNDMDFFQRLSAIWSGQAGSFFFWTFLVVLIYVIFRNMFRKYAHETFFWRSFILFALQAAILAVLTILTDPFELTGEVLVDGLGLNPFLLNFWNIIHPPIIFIGYALCLVPMVIGIVKISILEEGKVPDFDGKKQLNHYLEFMVSLAWLILSSGIIVGGYWAYVTLGWGGFWAWDPVETASLIPWFFLTLYYHGKSFHNKSAYLANYILSMTYIGVLFATYITRSGIITSVHTFQPEGTLENILKLFIPRNSFIMNIILRFIPNEKLLLLFIVFMGAFLALHFLGIKNKEITRIPITLSRSDFQESKSRTTALKISYISFLIGSYVIIIGLIAPVIYDIIGYLLSAPLVYDIIGSTLFGGNLSRNGFIAGITVGPVFYNTVLIIFGGIMLFTQFFCTFYPRLSINKKFGLLTGGVIAGGLYAISGYLYRTGFLVSTFGEKNPILTFFSNFWTNSDKANFVIPLLLLGMVGLIIEFIKVALREEKNLIRKTSQTMLHLSFLVILLGAVTSANMTTTYEVQVQAGVEAVIPGTSLTIQILDLERNVLETGLHTVEYDTVFMLSSGNRPISLGLSRVGRDKLGRYDHEVTIISDLFADIYIVSANPEDPNLGIFAINQLSGGFVVTILQIKIVPYINILWAGCLFLHFAIFPLMVGRLFLLKKTFSIKEKETKKAITKTSDIANENKNNGGE
ncbi:MAG: cytochrome c biogenesis protein CcsA [Candidatus Hodarchaeota archaeon]